LESENFLSLWLESQTVSTDSTLHIASSSGRVILFTLDRNVRARDGYRFLCRHKHGSNFAYIDKISLSHVYSTRLPTDDYDLLVTSNLNCALLKQSRVSRAIGIHHKTKVSVQTVFLISIFSSIITRERVKVYLKLGMSISSWALKSSRSCTRSHM
jgi:hypothetical protein